MWSSRFRYRGSIDAHSDWVNDLLIYNSRFLISCSEDKTIKVRFLSLCHADLGHGGQILHADSRRPHRRRPQSLLSPQLPGVERQRLQRAGGDVSPLPPRSGTCKQARA